MKRTCLFVKSTTTRIDITRSNVSSKFAKLNHSVCYLSTALNSDWKIINR